MSYLYNIYIIELVRSLVCGQHAEEYKLPLLPCLAVCHANACRNKWKKKNQTQLSLAWQSVLDLASWP